MASSFFSRYPPNATPPPSRVLPELNRPFGICSSTYCHYTKHPSFSPPSCSDPRVGRIEHPLRTLKVPVLPLNYTPRNFIPRSEGNFLEGPKPPAAEGVGRRRTGMGGRKGRMGKGKMGSRISGEGLVGEAALGRPDPAALSPPLRGRGRYPLAPFFPPH